MPRSNQRSQKDSELASEALAACVAAAPMAHRQRLAHALEEWAQTWPGSWNRAMRTRELARIIRDVARACGAGVEALTSREGDPKTTEEN